MKKLEKIEDIPISTNIKEILKKAGYSTVEELTLVSKEVIETLFKEELGNDVGDFYFRYLKAILHYIYYVTFLGEYDSLGLTPEIANIPIDDLNLTTLMKNVLKNQLFAYTLGDILTIDYEDFFRLRNFGDRSLEQLKDCVHQFGYTLKGEKTTLKEKLALLRENGVKLLEETISCPRICWELYRNDIYTMDELLAFGPEFHKLVGFGPLREKELIQKLKELNISFDESELSSSKKSEDTFETITDTIVTKAEKENNFIKSRIKQKEELLNEYDHLMKERKLLIARELELDNLIQSKLNDMKGVISRGRK